jgi:hypothetical protein
MGILVGVRPANIEMLVHLEPLRKVEGVERK